MRQIAWTFAAISFCAVTVTGQTWVQSAKLLASDGSPSDRFAVSVAISGDTLVMGAPQRESARGVVYVFVKPASGWQNMTQVARLTASDRAPADEFSESVAIFGDTIVVGSTEDNVGNNISQGSAYVYEKPSGGWTDMTETAKLTAGDGVAQDQFGKDVAIDEDTIVVGASRDDGKRGSAYVFVRPPGGWTTMTHTARLFASDRAPLDQFGKSVAISGATVVVGAPTADVGTNVDQGKAYAFVRPSTGWADAAETAKLTASDGATFDAFGVSVAIDRDTIVVGSRFDSIGPRSAQGSAYVFVEPGTGWTDATETAKLTASDGAAGDQAGEEVAIAGDTIVVGAPFEDAIPTFDQGKVYVFSKPIGGWITANETASLNAGDGATGDHFGWGMALAGDAVLVGAPNNVGRGSAYLFRRVAPIPCAPGDLLIADDATRSLVFMTPTCGPATLTTLCRRDPSSPATIRSVRNDANNQRLVLTEAGGNRPETLLGCDAAGVFHIRTLPVSSTTAQSSPAAAILDQDGTWLIAMTNANAILRYDPESGARSTLTTFGTNRLAGVTLDDDNGDWVVAMDGPGPGSLLRIDRVTLSRTTVGTTGGTGISAVDHDQHTGSFFVVQRTGPANVLAVDRSGNTVASLVLANANAIRVVDHADLVYCITDTEVHALDKRLTLVCTWRFPGARFRAIDVCGLRTVAPVGSFIGSRRVAAQSGAIHHVRGSFTAPGAASRPYCAAVSVGLRPGVPVRGPGCTTTINLNVGHPLLFATACGRLDGVLTTQFVGATGSDGSLRSSFALPAAPVRYTLHYSAVVPNPAACNGLITGPSLSITVP